MIKKIIQTIASLLLLANTGQSSTPEKGILPPGEWVCLTFFDLQGNNAGGVNRLGEQTWMSWAIIGDQPPSSRFVHRSEEQVEELANQILRRPDVFWFGLLDRGQFRWGPEMHVSTDESVKLSELHGRAGMVIDLFMQRYCVGLSLKGSPAGFYSFHGAGLGTYLWSCGGSQRYESGEDVAGLERASHDVLFWAVLLDDEKVIVRSAPNTRTQQFSLEYTEQDYELIRQHPLSEELASLLADGV
jgi:hypothetical protein